MLNILKISRRGGPSTQALMKIIESRELDPDVKRSYLTAIITNINAKRREVGLRALAELCRISEDPLSDLDICAYGVRDNVMAQEIINTIASMGMERADVWNRLVSIAESKSGSRAARRYARDICISYHEDRGRKYWDDKAAVIRTPRDAMDAVREKLESDTGSGRLLPPLPKSRWQFWK